MNNYFKKQEGFTLIEIILSIAILSVVSVVVLRLFIVSNDINADSLTSDLANNSAVNMIEDIRQYDSISQFLTHYPWIQQNDTAYLGHVYYDSTFKATSDISDYSLVCSLIEDYGIANLYTLQITIVENETKDEILSYETKHYFKHKE